MKNNRSFITTIQCALLLAIGLSFRYFSAMIPIGGILGIRISASGFFYKMTPLLFGSAYGAVVGGLSDFLGWLIRQDEGAYIFPMTLTAALGGGICGFSFKMLKDKIFSKKTDVIYFIVSILFGVFACINFCVGTFFKNSAYGIFLSELNDSIFFLITYGCAAVCVIAILLLFVNRLLSKKLGETFAQLYAKILVSLLVAYIPVTTINTFILLWFYPALRKLNFYVVYIPRLIEEVLTSLITAYVLTLLYRVYMDLKNKYIIK